MQVVPLLAMGFLTAFYYLARRALYVKQDAQEPPCIPSSIPFIGHIIGIFRQEADYYGYLR